MAANALLGVVPYGEAAYTNTKSEHFEAGR